MAIYFTRYNCGQLIRILSLYYHNRKYWRTWMKKMVDGNILDKVLVKIKQIIGIKKFHDTKILIETEDKLYNNITLRRWY